MLIDYWAHRHWDDPKLRTEEFDPDFDAEVEAMEAELAAASAPGTEWETVADDTFGGDL